MNELAFTPYQLAGVELSNRIAMAPMTRTRATDGVPDTLTQLYYSQRATAGLIITEGTSPSIEGQGYPDTPGLHSSEQRLGWSPVTARVHEQGGVIFAQLMHVGRIGDPDLLPDGHVLFAPSAVAAAGEIYTHQGPRPYVVPKEMTPEDIQYVIDQFAASATNAIEAGFDGVELHGANGYLINQFLSSNVNLRTDEWGGSIAGRVKFAIEVTRATIAAVGADRVGFRISPSTPIHDIQEEGRDELYLELIEQLRPLGLAYLHVAENRDCRELVEEIASRWEGTLILNPFTEGRPTAGEELELLGATTKQGRRLADIIAYGAYFISNPDLPRKLREGRELVLPDRNTLYGQGPGGYTDWPFIDDAEWPLAEELPHGSLQAIHE